MIVHPWISRVFSGSPRKCQYNTFSQNKTVSFCKPSNSLHDIFVNYNWVDTQWQQYNTHLHANSTQNNTMEQNTWDGTYITIRIHKHRIYKIKQTHTKHETIYIEWQKDGSKGIWKNVINGTKKQKLRAFFVVGKYLGIRTLVWPVNWFSIS